MSFLYFCQNKGRKMTKILRNITKYKECQNLMDSGVLCLETLLKTYYNKTQFLRKNNVEDCRKEDFAKNDRVLSEQSKKIRQVYERRKKWHLP